MKEKLLRYVLLLATPPLALILMVAVAPTAVAAQSAMSGAAHSSITAGDPFFGPCTFVEDGATFTDPSTGIEYICHFASGAGWNWVPICSLYPSICGDAPMVAYVKISLKKWSGVRQQHGMTM
jgi:hypothetical protein